MFFPFLALVLLSVGGLEVPWGSVAASFHHYAKTRSTHRAFFAAGGDIAGTVGRTVTSAAAAAARIRCISATTTTGSRHDYTSSATFLSSRLFLAADENEDGREKSSAKAEGVQEYRNVATQVLSMFMNKKEDDDDGTSTEGGGSDKKKKETDPVLSAIDFNASKLSRKFDLETLAQVLDYELYNSEWFVTGKVNPIYFSDKFKFEDPDVKLEGIENYARGVRTIFDQETSRAEIISTEVSTSVANTITVTWRLSGKANIGPGLTLKPYIVYTDFTIDEDGLIVFQRDRFDLPQWDILLSSLFPFLIGKVTSDPAPPVEPRVVTMPAAAVAALEPRSREK